MSLPYILGITLDSIPASIPYLSVPAHTPAPRLSGEGLRVGLVWRGNPQHENDKWRSISLAHLKPVLDVPGIHFFSLQAGEKAAVALAAQPWAERIEDLAPALKDFAHTAAIIAALDLVITVDTAVAHVAGALGKPVWVLIAQGNDWRWLHKRPDTPWYPTMRLFRQRRERNWRPAINAMVKALSEMGAKSERA